MRVAENTVGICSLRPPFWAPVFLCALIFPHSAIAVSCDTLLGEIRVLAQTLNVPPLFLEIWEEGQRKSLEANAFCFSRMCDVRLSRVQGVLDWMQDEIHQRVIEFEQNGEKDNQTIENRFGLTAFHAELRSLRNALPMRYEDFLLLTTRFIGLIEKTILHNKESLAFTTLMDKGALASDSYLEKAHEIFNFGEYYPYQVTIPFPDPGFSRQDLVAMISMMGIMVGLVAAPKHVHGAMYSPMQYIYHDFLHGVLVSRATSDSVSAYSNHHSPKWMYVMIRDQLQFELWRKQEVKKNAPFHMQKTIDDIYFFLLHEIPYAPNPVGLLSIPLDGAKIKEISEESHYSVSDVEVVLKWIQFFARTHLDWWEKNRQSK